MFGGIPDTGLQALIEKDETPLLVLGSGGGMAWRFMREVIRGDEFCEAPFELGYAINNQPRKIGTPSVFAGWAGEDMLFPSEGCNAGEPPYLKNILEFGHEVLVELGWKPVELRLVEPPRNESVPLACRVWRKPDPDATHGSRTIGKVAWGWRVMKSLSAPTALRYHGCRASHGE